MYEIQPSIHNNTGENQSPVNKTESLSQPTTSTALDYYKQLANYFDSQDEANSGRFLKAYLDLLNTDSQTLSEKEIDVLVKKLIPPIKHVQGLQKLGLTEYTQGSLGHAFKEVIDNYSKQAKIDELMTEYAKYIFEQNTSANTRFMVKSDPNKIMHDYTGFSNYSNTLSLTTMLSITNSIQNRFYVAINEFAKLSQDQGQDFDFDQTIIHIRAILITLTKELGISKRKEYKRLIVGVVEAICNQDFIASANGLSELSKILPEVIDIEKLKELGIWPSDGTKN